MGKLSLFLLGSPRVERDGRALELGRRKACALFACLAITGRGHSRHALATSLRPESDQSSARAKEWPELLAQLDGEPPALLLMGWRPDFPIQTTSAITWPYWKD